MLSIGEFSRVTQLSIKALRLYHEKGILIPNRIDVDSKYRYYSRDAVERGLIVKKLKDMGFSLLEIKEIVRECNDDGQLARHVESKLKEVKQKIEEYEKLKTELSSFLAGTEDETMKYPEHIQRETIADQVICGIRFKGRYNEVGPRFGRLGRACGRWAIGKPFSMYYDGDYKEEGADIEACFSVKKTVSAEGIDCRELKGGEAVTLIHRGPYRELNRSYMRLFEYCREQGLETALPIREQYIKGPGMIFKGNPAKYVTKIMLMLVN
jgi:DNA-binding transcriptional MerR regulator